MVMGKPHHTSSMPEIKFIPKILATSVGIMRMILRLVIFFIKPDILLLMTLA